MKRYFPVPFHRVCLCLVAALLVAICGCETLDKMKEDNQRVLELSKPQYVISVHQIVAHPRANMLEKEAPTFDGRTIWINVNPLIHSQDIKKIELVERKDQKLNPLQESFPVKKKEKGKEGDDEEEEEEIPVDPSSSDPSKPAKPVPPSHLTPTQLEPKFYDLKLFLTRRGALAWMQISAGFRHEKLAFVIDGIFYRTFTPTKVSTEEDETVILEGPIDETCAMQIRKHAKKNFKYFSDKGATEKSGGGIF
jgi:hypothetical protein